MRRNTTLGARAACSVVLLLALVSPGSATAHLDHGHVIQGAAAISPGPSGWSSMSVHVHASPTLHRGFVTLDDVVIPIECAVVVDEVGINQTPSHHFVKVGWTIDAIKYQLWMDAGTNDPTLPFFEIFTVRHEGGPCERGDLGGLAIGLGNFTVIG